MTKRGPKRTKPLDPTKMITVTCRFPVWLLLKLDEEAARIARETGLSAINRSDVIRQRVEHGFEPPKLNVAGADSDVKD